MRLYLDIETYRPRKEDTFANETIIVIGVIEDWTQYHPESAKVWGEPKVMYRFFTLWDMDEKSTEDKEKELVNKFYKYLKRFINEYKAGHIKFLNVVGFNILRYDIPLLIQKGIEYGIAPAAELNAIWHDIFTIDYFQTSLPFHSMRFKNLRLELLAEWARKAGIDVPEPYGSGEDVPRWYEEKRYEDILLHLRRDLEILRIIDLNFKKVYGAIVDSLSRREVM